MRRAASPRTREAYVRLRKEQVSFPDIQEAYRAVARWVGEQGLTITAEPREVYFTDFDAAGPTDEVCNVAYPIA